MSLQEPPDPNQSPSSTPWTQPLADHTGSTSGSRPLTALPSRSARILAFASILVGGVCGGVIGAAIVGVQCTGNCATAEAIGALLGAVVIALGVSVIAVLALRAMGEWRQQLLE